MRKKSQQNIENLLKAIEGKKFFSSCFIQTVHITQAAECRISDFDYRTHQIDALKGEMLFHHKKTKKNYTRTITVSHTFLIVLFLNTYHYVYFMCVFFFPF